MAFDFQGLVDAVASHALATGEFDTVNTHEPRSVPGNGVACSIWASLIAPVSSSGLNSVSMLIELTMRVQMPSQTTQPLDEIDPAMMQAVAVLMSTFAGGFTMGGIVREVDLLGQHSQGLRAKPGYINPNNVLCRVFDVTLPVIINDLLVEVP